MSVDGYVPERGDLVWISFSPHAGHEQAGRRPGLVVSPSRYNGPSGLALICPVTSQVKGYPYEVRLPDEPRVSGVVLSDQVRNFDWRARNAAFVESVPESVIRQVLRKLATLVSFPT